MLAARAELSANLTAKFVKQTVTLPELQILTRFYRSEVWV